MPQGSSRAVQVRHPLLELRVRRVRVGESNHHHTPADRMDSLTSIRHPALAESDWAAEWDASSASCQWDSACLNLLIVFSLGLVYLSSCERNLSISLRVDVSSFCMPVLSLCHTFLAFEGGRS